MTTTVVTGSASGIGAAIAARLVRGGHRVIGIDRVDADIECDLATVKGRAQAIDIVRELSGGVVHGLVPCAGIAGRTGTSGGAMVSVNYFGTVALLEGLRPELAAAGESAVVCLSSNSTTCQPNWPLEIAEACLAGDESQAVQVADAHSSVATYPATKAALAWYVRTHAPTPDWIGAGIRLNAIAPGLIETAMTAGQRADPVLGPALERFPVPRGRAGQPDEVAAVIEFLLGPGAALICGSVLFADGGTDALLRARDWPGRWQF